MWMLFRLFLMFNNFYRLDLHNKACVSLANVQGSVSITLIASWTYLDFVMVRGSACSLSIELLMEYIRPPNCIHQGV